VLGSSGTFAGAQNPCSGYLVRHDGASVLLDCGPGTLGPLQRHLPVGGLDAVVLSHEHPDHWLELPVLRNAWKYVLCRDGLDVYGTADTLTLAEALCHGELAPTLRWHVVTDGDEVTIGPLRARFSRTDHPPETLGVALGADGRWLGYSADTGADWSMAELGVDVELAVWEATVLDHLAEAVEGVHCTAAQTGRGARAAGVRRLLITHLLPGSDPGDFRAEAAETYGAPVQVAEPGATHTV